MEKQLARVVNKGYAGEPEYIVIQELESNKIFELSQIKTISEASGETTSVSINDNDLNQDLIQRILNQGHTVNITWDESDNVTCHFD